MPGATSRSQLSQRLNISTCTQRQSASNSGGESRGEAVTRTRPLASSDSGRADQRNHLAFVPAVNAKILAGCDHAVVWIKLAHPDQTKIGQIGLPVGITFGQVRQLRQMIVQIKRDLYQLADNHFEDDFNAPQFES